MQQHLMQMQPMMAAYYPNNVTTDHIQQYLDENKSLILKIVESQNSGKLSECAENQARLQRNLMYLAAIADSQPQPPTTMHPQFASSGIMQPGAHYLQHQQTQQMTPQSLVAARSSMLYSQQPYSALQQQALHSQLGMSSGGSTGLHMLPTEASTAGGSGTLGAAGGFPDFGRGSTGEGLHAGGRGLAGGSKQDVGSAGTAEVRAGNSGTGDGGEALYLKGADDGN
ncbi:GRF1-interacting factor 1 isoform X1 [Carica papaya]|uniref:GRF1-interacting factor 1 isoform X1 n=2 Tax=Carica papaya TaxID=3649 RepID=UPI000B8C7199|nr:GRF1-interacting factor 1 isoform X1 [Carica papaya]